MSPLPPIRREVLVDAAPPIAFEVFTAGIDRWWPLGDLSVYGGEATVAFADGRIVETGPDGQTAVWGTVTEWQPPAIVGFTWHPGHPAERAGAITVTFAAVGEQTLVTLEHGGWEAREDPETARTEYGHGWPIVLAHYADTVGAPPLDGTPPEGAPPDDAASEADAPAPEAVWTWVVLEHTPAPGTPEGPGIFGHELFGEHVAFLERMNAAGYLVAAGPLADEIGAGMAVLRLPGAGRMEEAARLVTTDDGSVTGGLFTVVVRPWDVRLHA